LNLKSNSLLLVVAKIVFMESVEKIMVKANMSMHVVLRYVRVCMFATLHILFITTQDMTSALLPFITS
jgi:hypothetical protein